MLVAAVLGYLHEASGEYPSPCLKHQPELQCAIPREEPDFRGMISGEGDNNLEDILVLSFSCFSYFLLFPTPNQVTFCSLPALLYLIPE